MFNYVGQIHAFHQGLEEDGEFHSQKIRLSLDSPNGFEVYSNYDRKAC